MPAPVDLTSTLLAMLERPAPTTTTAAASLEDVFESWLDEELTADQDDDAPIALDAMPTATWPLPLRDDRTDEQAIAATLTMDAPISLEPRRPQSPRATDTSAPPAPKTIEVPAWLEPVVTAAAVTRDGRVSEARIDVVHPELGELRVTVVRDGDRLAIRFTTSDAAAERVISAELPTLHATLADRGLAIAETRFSRRTRRTKGGAHGNDRRQPNVDDDTER